MFLLLPGQVIQPKQLIRDCSPPVVTAQHQNLKQNSISGAPVLYIPPCIPTSPFSGHNAERSYYALLGEVNDEKVVLVDKKEEGKKVCRQN